MYPHIFWRNCELNRKILNLSEALKDQHIEPHLNLMNINSNTQSERLNFY